MLFSLVTHPIYSSLWDGVSYEEDRTVWAAVFSYTGGHQWKQSPYLWVEAAYILPPPYPIPIFMGLVLLLLLLLHLSEI